MKSLIQTILLAVAVVVSAQPAAAQLDQPIESQFRIVTYYKHFLWGGVLKMTRRCMGVLPDAKLLGFYENTLARDEAYCASNASLFTILQDGRLFLGDYSAGTAQQVFLTRDDVPTLKDRAYTIDPATHWLDSPRLRLTSQNMLQDRVTDSRYAFLNNGVLIKGLWGTSPIIERVPSVAVRQFRLKRTNNRTNIISCATTKKNGVISFPALTTQSEADQQCAAQSSIFTLNTATGELSINSQLLTRGAHGLIRTASAQREAVPFSLKPDLFNRCCKMCRDMCRIDGGLFSLLDLRMLWTEPWSRDGSDLTGLGPDAVNGPAVLSDFSIEMI